MSISDLKDIHSGKLCFIYGAGPSLRYVDENLLKDYINIAVNSGIDKNARFDYFVSDDSAISGWSYYKKVARYDSGMKKLLYRDRFEPICKTMKNVEFFSHTWWFSPSDKKYNLDGLKLTKDEPIVGARTSVGSAIHLAYIMGCDPIVLLGNDCRLIDGKRYFWQYNKKSFQPFRIFGPEFNERTHSLGFQRDSFVEYWNKFAEVNNEIIGKDVDIIDCSDSRLNCFRKMHLQEILDRYGDRK